MSELKEVLARLESLEAKVGTISRPSAAAKLEKADIAAYHKVQLAFWEDGTCGINETSPCIIRCNIVTGGRIVPIPKACDFECTCGPCNIWGAVRGGGWRFGGLGG